MGADRYGEYIQSIRLDLLELFGSGYVIQHCISAFTKDQKEQLYRVYITDALKIIAENTARSNGGNMIQARYAELINPPEEETRTKDEIVGNIRAKIRGMRESK